MAGFVYIMSNPSIPGLLKIGVTDKDPEEFRSKDLYNTSVPDPFKVEYYAYTMDHNIIERETHEKLINYRHSKSREYFSCDVITAINTIQSIAGRRIKYDETSYSIEETILTDPPSDQSSIKRGIYNQNNYSPDLNEASFSEHGKLIEKNWLNGKTFSKGYLRNGKKEGNWRRFYESGSLKHREIYKNGIIESWEVFYQNGNLQRMGYYKDAKREGRWEQYFLNGQINWTGVFVSGRKDGLWETFHKNGQMYLSEKYLLGTLNGPWSEFSERGQSLNNGMYYEGREEGEWHGYYENGKQRYQGLYTNGNPEGKWERFWSNGQLMSQGNYIKGQEDGAWKRYHGTGKLSSVGNYNLGKKDETWEYFDEDGNRLKEEKWSNGVLSKNKIKTY